jgi:hypothetical protein
MCTVVKLFLIKLPCTLNIKQINEKAMLKAKIRHDIKEFAAPISVYKF